MIELRPAQFSDHDSIALLHAESWRKTYRGIFSDRFLNDDIEKNRLEVWYDRLRSPATNQEVTIAVQHNSIVGFSCIYLDEDATYGTLLDNFHVSSNFQRSGIGKLLMQNCARLISEKGNSLTMYLWVFEANQNARRVYERLGGTNVETVKKQNEDGTEAKVCRYIWADVRSLM